MGVERRPPVGDEQVEADHAVEVVAALFPALGEVGLRPVVEVPHVAHRDDAALPLGGGRARHVGLPVAVVAGRDRAPPAAHGRPHGEGPEARVDEGPDPGEHHGHRDQESRHEEAGQDRLAGPSIQMAAAPHSATNAVVVARRPTAARFIFVSPWR